MAYLYGRGDGDDEELGPEPSEEPNLTPAVVGPSALAAVVIFVATLVFDSDTEDTPWTAGSPAVFIGLVALITAPIVSWRLARGLGATPAGALLAAVTTLVAAPLGVVGAYVVLSIAGA